ncbi:hypothetical protein ANCCAN_22666 [Ancylostoma caninum]|uniref:Uncharacterized protein n=1 Tax=Ancylostoma caninum TaxID=29170 RepID=A0A368FL48_ANCCA|nr:hypothetical protein ANCCAN_22666 [Ancylostoma caninum]
MIKSFTKKSFRKGLKLLRSGLRATVTDYFIGNLLNFWAEPMTPEYVSVSFSRVCFFFLFANEIDALVDIGNFIVQRSHSCVKRNCYSKQQFASWQEPLRFDPLKCSRATVSAVPMRNVANEFDEPEFTDNPYEEEHCDDDHEHLDFPNGLAFRKRMVSSFFAQSY